MAQVEIRLDLPPEVAALLGETAAIAARSAKRALLAELLRQGKISQGKAAEALGVTRHAIIDLMAEFDVPSGPLSEEELRRDASNALQAATPSDAMQQP